MKTEAVKRHMVEINPDLEETVELRSNGWDGQKLFGYIFLCVDNIELRKKICVSNKFNDEIKAVFDFRTGLTEFQHYAADWNNLKQKNALLEQMNFTHEEANEATPMSACRVALCVAPTVRMVVNLGVCNFINFINKHEIKTGLIGDAFNFLVVEL